MSIPIRYANKTDNIDFQVIVFTKNYSPNNPETYYAAWQVLSAQSEVSFSYPVEIEVGATYKSGGQDIVAGPFDAQLGSTWNITQETLDSTATLEQGES